MKGGYWQAKNASWYSKASINFDDIFYQWTPNPNSAKTVYAPHFGGEFIDDGLRMVEQPLMSGAASFFQNASYTSKVLNQMSKSDDILHAFPKSIDGMATEFGQYSTKLGADGKIYHWLKMSGSYEGKTGIFEYVKDANGLINHRFFNIHR